MQANAGLWTIALFVGLLLFSCSALASYEERLFDSTLYAGENFTFATNHSLAVFSVTGDERIIISLDGKMISIKNQSCETFFPYKACYYDASFGYYNTSKPSSPFTYTIVNKYRVSLYKLLANVEIKKSISETNIGPDIQTYGTIKIENTGSDNASQLLYNDAFPSNFLVRNVVGCSLNNNTITFQGTILPDEIRTCTFSLIALTPVDFSSQGKASYWNGDRMVIVFSPSIALKVNDYSIQVSENITNSTPFIGQRINVSLDLSPSYDLLVDYRLKIPEGLSVAKTNGLRLIQNEYLSLDAYLRKGDNQTFIVELIPVKTGNYVLHEHVRYSINTSVNFSRFIPVNISMQPMEIRFINSSNRIEIQAVNPSHVPYYHISADISTNLSIPNKLYIGNLEPGTYRSFFYNVTKNYSILVNLNYESEYGESFSLKKEFFSGSLKSVVSNLETQNPLTEQIANPEQNEGKTESADEQTNDLEEKTPKKFNFRILLVFIPFIVVVAFFYIIFYVMRLFYK